MASLFGLIFACLSKFTQVLEALNRIESEIQGLAQNQAAMESRMDAECAAINAKLDQIISLVGTPVGHKVARSNPSYGQARKSNRRT